MRDEWSPDELILELTPNAIEVVLDLNVDAVYDLALDILEEVSGRYWWVAVRIVGAVTYAWDVMGPEGIFHGVDPERLSLAAWLDAMLLLLLRRIDPQQAPMFTARLEMPPEGEEVPEEEMEISAAQFMSMAGD